VAKPSFAVADVSDDNEYTGRWLAGAAEAEIRRVIERSLGH